MLEELKSCPWQAIWDYYCVQTGVPVGTEWLAEVKDKKKRYYLSDNDYWRYVYGTE